MGFRNFKAFNQASLARQTWRILKNEDSLMARCLKAKYFPRKLVTEAQKGYRPSFTWRSIHEASWVMKKGGYWRIGNGENIKIWQDGWLPHQNGHKTWTT